MELQRWSQKLRINKITAETTKGLFMKNLPTLRNDSSLAVQFSISVSKTRAILVFTIKIIEMLELHASIRAEYPAKISHNYLGGECLDNQPIKITTRFLGSDDVTGRL